MDTAENLPDRCAEGRIRGGVRGDRCRDAPAGRKNRLEHIRVTPVIVATDQHILMENDGIVKHGFVFIRKNRMDQVRLDQDDIAGVCGDQAILILKISRPAFYII